MKIAFEDLCNRFDLRLKRDWSEGDRQRGILILDESAQETTLQEMSRDFRTIGTQWGVVHSLAETPLFVDSRASRAVQLADHVAYSVFRYYEAEDAQYFNIIAPRFDQSENVVHGLSHRVIGSTCMCPACLSRR